MDKSVKILKAIAKTNGKTVADEVYDSFRVRLTSIVKSLTNNYCIFPEQHMAEEQYRKEEAEQSQDVSLASLFRSPRLRKHTLLMMST